MLAKGVHDAGTQMHKARVESERTWDGAAGERFRSMMSGGARRVDEVATDTAKMGQSFHRVADDLHTSQAGMARARQIARDGGLEINGTQILEPGSAPTAPQSLPADGTATPQQAKAHADAVAAQQIHARKVEAFNAAKEEASTAGKVWDGAKRYFSDVGKDAWGKKYFVASEFGKNLVETYGKSIRNDLVKESDRLKGVAETWAKRYAADAKLGPFSPSAKVAHAEQMAAQQAADDTARRAGNIGSRVLSKLPGLGWAITAGGIGYDIANGKPAGKAIISGLGGMAAGGAAIALASGPPGWVAGGAVAIGVGVGVGLDYVYDALPDGLKKGIEDGVKAVGNAASDAVNAVGSAAKKVWNSLFG
ncbi:hypothetical protein EV193_106279 [Herbihabitans rhizosphaerae]|uniref:Type VII secretion system (Wss) protein ESAT-6 n=1 Tax=Herbihabitans rhizosphaerae TaxID=1872711 RepID=A0A4V2ESC0_9PSEU|nr:hypothetical protein [Herbihabitans rhizosphaerae]RZS37043.1 hypothetical protein EV193_106279 [Herbihabitans rhizosphaerae]